ncbi:thioredoxin family protein [Pseudomonas sp. GD03858]|uniref:thioredoxin family protein n=1 Tax=unclassified Pseudomonas TaxID=196821 RepID=UPI002446A7E4|nr:MULTISPECIES: thioredoxin family protein [unclassified Pseudomonas]MDH0648643.1 thioredoxin family protein [Pseudomonas sp. GD03867]MDH0661682.1 thioredoxin family protein [Pseudomonas sp. GD03858]
MAMVALTDLEALVSLVTRDHPGVPTLLLIHSDQCPPCKALHPKLVALAGITQGCEFYEFNVDTCGDDQQLDDELTLLFQEWDVKYLPTQILLAPGQERKVIFTTNLDTIQHELASLKYASEETSRQNS